MDHVVERLLRHSAANAVKLVLSVGTGLAVPPLIIRFVGIEAFGAWAIVCAIGQLVCIADFGLPAAVSKYVAESSDEDRPQRIGQVLTAALVVYGAVTLGVLGLVAMGRAWLHVWLVGGDPAGPASAVALIVVMTAVSCLNLGSGVLGGVLAGLHRMDVASHVGSVGALLSFAVTVGLLVSGAGLWAPAAGSALASVVTMLLLGRYVRETSGYQRLLPRGLRPQNTAGALGRLLFLSSSDGTNRAASVIVGSGIRFLLGATAGLPTVGYYDLTSRFVAQLAMIPVIVSSPLVPAVAALAGARDGVNEVVRRVLKYMNIVSLPVFVFSVVFADEIVRAWLGSGFEPVSLGVRILGVATYVNMLTAPAYHSLIGLGQPRLGIQFGLLNVGLNGVATTLLTWRWGFAGAVAGQGLALGAASLYLLVRFHRQQMLPLVSTHRETFGKPFVVASIASIPVAVGYHLLASLDAYSGRLGVLAAACGTFTLILGALLWWGKVVGRRDLESVRGLLRG